MTLDMSLNELDVRPQMLFLAQSSPYSSMTYGEIRRDRGNEPQNTGQGDTSMKCILITGANSYIGTSVERNILPNGRTGIMWTPLT